MGPRGTFIKHWLTYLAHEQESQESTVKEELSEALLCDWTNEELPVISVDGTKMSSGHWCMYICPKTCWLILRPFVKGIAELDNYFGHLSAYICDIGSKRSIVWHMDECKHERCKYNGKFWFLIPAYLNKPFQSLLSQEFGLFYGKTQFRRFIGESTCQPENYPVHVPSTWLLHVVHHDEVDSAFLCGATTDSLWSDATLERTAMGTISSLVTRATNPMECFLWNNCSQQRADTAAVHKGLNSGTVSSYAESQTPMKEETGAEFEIHELDLKRVKTEPESEFTDQRISAGSSNGIFLHQEEKSENARFRQLRTFLEKYSGLMSSLGIQSCGREPFIVVECPLCPTAYKGTRDRLLHLINHVERRHHKYKCEELVTTIELTYGRLIQFMERRVKKKTVLG